MTKSPGSGHPVAAQAGDGGRRDLICEVGKPAVKVPTEAPR